LAFRDCFGGLEFGVQGLGFGIRGSGFGVRGSGFRIWGSGFEISGPGWSGLNMENVDDGYGAARRESGHDLVFL